jgi:hypothetical protein
VTFDPVPGNNSATQSTAVLGASGCDDANSCTQDACDGASNSCTHTTILPPEVSHLRLGANKTSLAWDSQGPGVTYDVARGIAGQWPVGSGGSETCVAPQIPAASTSDGAFPAAGNAFWYLARARTTCGAGGYGTASSGTPRVTAACP